MPLPLVSVLVTSFNQRAYLAEALESALGQTHRPIEIVVVDDGSTDGSPALIQHYLDRHPGEIRAVWHRGNRGVSAARNSALAVARGEWITTLDGDDVFLPGKVARELAAAEAAGGKVVVYSNFHWIGPDGARLRTWDEGGGAPEGRILRQLFRCEFPRSEWCRSELMPRAALDAEMNDERLVIYEDVDLKLRLGAAWPFVYVAEPLHLYRRHAQGGSLSRAGPEVYFASMWRIWSRRRLLLATLPAADRRAAARSWRAAMAGHRVSAACGRLAAGANGAALRDLVQAAAIDLRAVPLRLWARCLLPRALAGRRRTGSGPLTS